MHGVKSLPVHKTGGPKAAYFGKVWLIYDFRIKFVVSSFEVKGCFFSPSGIVFVGKSERPQRGLQKAWEFKILRICLGRPWDLNGRR